MAKILRLAWEFRSDIQEQLSYWRYWHFGEKRKALSANVSSRCTVAHLGAEGWSNPEDPNFQEMRCFLRSALKLLTLVDPTKALYIKLAGTEGRTFVVDAIRRDIVDYGWVEHKELDWRDNYGVLKPALLVRCEPSNRYLLDTLAGALIPWGSCGVHVEAFLTEPKISVFREWCRIQSDEELIQRMLSDALILVELDEMQEDLRLVSAQLTQEDLGARLASAIPQISNLLETPSGSTTKAGVGQALDPREKILEKLKGSSRKCHHCGHEGVVSEDITVEAAGTGPFSWKENDRWHVEIWGDFACNDWEACQRRSNQERP